jgi:DNA-binding IclR family transcriptional regulator
VAAIGISGPTSRLTLDILPRVTQVVQDIGKILSSRLSFKLDQT